MSVKSILHQFCGQHNNISIPRPLIRLLGYKDAAVMGQLIFWDGKYNQHWFWKKYKVLGEQLELSESQITSSVAKLAKLKLIDKKSKKRYFKDDEGNDKDETVTWFNICYETLGSSLRSLNFNPISEIEDSEPAKSKTPICEIKDSRGSVKSKIPRGSVKSKIVCIRSDKDPKDRSEENNNIIETFDLETWSTSSAEGDILIQLPTSDKLIFDVTREIMNKMTKEFPDLYAPEAIQDCRRWLVDNIPNPEAKPKSHGGMRNFIRHWFNHGKTHSMYPKPKSNTQPDAMTKQMEINKHVKTSGRGAIDAMQAKFTERCREGVKS